MDNIADVIVVGAGAAGLMAAGTAAYQGAQVLVLEKKETAGKKILISGKGRCNITNAGSTEEIMKNIPKNSQFLYGSLAKFSNQDCQTFFENFGVPVKIERGNRVFPVSDSAEDVVKALLDYGKGAGVRIKYNSSVKKILADNHMIKGVVLEDGETLYSKAVIITTGGMSAPGTGSTGDGYGFARDLGHEVIKPLPSLVPLETKEEWVKEAQGLTLKNVKLTAWQGQKKLMEDFGEMMFAHFGVTGPLVLTVSDSVVVHHMEKPGSVSLTIDLKPALTEEVLDQRLQRDFKQYLNKQFKNSLGELLPKSLIPVVIRLSGIDPEKPVHQVTKEERNSLIKLLKALPLSVRGSRSIKEAVVTAGGVNPKQISPKTMESKLVKGLYFAGEVLDLHGYTGGFNLQIAWSTGYAAGEAAGQQAIGS